MRAEDAHPSVGLLSGATLLAMKLVAAGRIRLSETGDSWRVGPLQPGDEDRLRALATARAHADTDADEAEDVIRQLLDAVADTMTRTPSTRDPGSFAQRRRVIASSDPDDPDLPEHVRLALRVEAPAEVLEGGGVVVVLQAHDVDDDTHFTDADQLWLGPEGAQGHGFSRKARLSLGRALRAAAEAWPPLDRLQRMQVPDRMVLDSDELAHLLEHGLEALDAIGIDVFWPRGLRGELIPQARVEVASGPREGQLMEGLFGPDALFSFDWRLALGEEALSDEEMAALAGATSPVIKLRDNWMVIDPAVARRARRRKAGAAAHAGRRPAGCADRSALPRRRSARGAPRRDAGEGARPHRRRGGRRTPGHPEGLAAPLRDYQRHGLTWLAELTGVRSRRLPRRRHGTGQDDHPDRPAPASSRPRAGGRPDAGGLPGQPDGQLGGRDPAVRARGRRTPLPRHRPRPRRARRRVRADHLRHHAQGTHG